MRCQINHQQKTHPCNSGQRQAGYACGHRRIINGCGNQPAEQHQPDKGNLRQTHMPAVEVEIGEKKDQQGGGQCGLRGGAPDSVRFIGCGKNFMPEAKINTDIGKNGPGQCGRCRKNHRALHHKYNGEKQRQKPRNADNNAVIQRQTGDFFFICIRIPHIDLRQNWCAQFGNIGDGGAGVDGEQKHVGIGTVLPLGGKPLACGNG